MALQSTTVYEEPLPILKVGHIIKVGAGYHIVREVLLGRFPVTNAAIKATVYALNAANNTVFNALSGNLDTKRIVHLQYIAVMTPTSIDVTPYWKQDPLMAKDVEAVINDVIAPQTCPLKLDKWSFDQSMFFGFKTASATSVVLMFIMVNYATAPFPAATPPSKYLEITAEGNARFVG